MSMPSPDPAPSAKIGLGQAVLLAAICAILLMTMIWAGYVWTATSNIEMSIHGWIALGLGTVFSLVIGCGLMALMFFSSRSGYDDSATPKIRKNTPES